MQGSIRHLSPERNMPDVGAGFGRASATAAILDAAEPLVGMHALVVGERTLEVLCALLGRGCTAAVETTRMDRHFGERAEIVLAPHVANEEDASRAIALARMALLPCGRVVIGLPTQSLVTQVARALGRAGFSAIRSRETSDGTVISADRPMFGLHGDTAHV